MMTLRVPAVCVLALLAGAPARVAGQNASYDGGQLYATRAHLEALLLRHEDASQTSVYSDVIRSIARSEAELIRTRLRDGDLEVGDQLTLTVSGQPTLSGTFTVMPGRMLVLPELPSMPLTGLLRSELQDSVTAFLSRFLRNPHVLVQSSLRLQVFGEVGQPGYKNISADYRITDLLESVGQPTRTAQIDKMKIKRGNDVIWDGDGLRQAIVEGRTVDQLSLRAGDILEVPGQKTRNFGQVFRDLYFLLPVGFAIMRIF